MSVHGEFSRAVEALIDRLRSLDHPEAETWISMLEATRIGGQPDLSVAAQAARRLLALMASDEIASHVAGLEEPRARLEAHCHAVLGR